MSENGKQMQIACVDEDCRFSHLGPHFHKDVLPLKPSAWIDEFGNVFPLAAYQPSGKPMHWSEAHKRNWKPLYAAPLIVGDPK